jgi:hypothetical protein
MYGIIDKSPSYGQKFDDDCGVGDTDNEQVSWYVKPGFWHPIFQSSTEIVSCYDQNNLSGRKHEDVRPRWIKLSFPKKTTQNGVKIKVDVFSETTFIGRQPANW